MVHRLTFVWLPLVAVACGGGDAGPVTTTKSTTQEASGAPGRDSPPSERDPSGAGRDPVAPSQDPPPPSQDPPGGPQGAGGACVACDAKYTCTGSASGVPITNAPFALKTAGGVCVVDGQTSVTAFGCNGKVTVDGVFAGTWQVTGNFSFSGQGLTLDCVPAPAPQPGKGG